jgi:glycosyltransferase involved in cell wall biosynthesis
LIRAARIVVATCPDVRFLLVGSAWGEAGEAALQRARELTRQLDLGASIIFLGHRRDIGAVLADLDITVQASVSENLGGSIEALLMECPIVATRSGGLVDTVVDGETGILVAPLDPDDLARGIHQMLAHPGMAKSMARTGRQEMLRHFCLDSTVRDLDGIYADFLHGGGYRPWRTAWRIVLAGPVFLYLAARLWLDIKGRPAMLGRLKTASTTFKNAPSIAGVANALLSTARTAAGRFGHWVRMRPLHIYGWLRKVLAGTALLALWDRVFARLRGR